MYGSGLQSADTASYHSGSMSPSRAHETADMRWAWSARPAGASSSARRSHHHHRSGGGGGDWSPAGGGGGGPPQDPSLQADMMEVVRLLSTATANCQTVEPSFTATRRLVHTDEAGNRAIGIQAGTASGTQNASTQVNENDVADVPESTAYDDEILGRGDHEQEMRSPNSGASAFATSVGCGSVHRPHSDVPADRFPTFVSDAKALGVCNRYGFISMPRPPMELAPRRRIKAINPVDYPHLYGTHDLQLDEGILNRVNRTHNLWVVSSGFVPKF